MNFATFAGRLGRDAELRKLPSDQSVLNFSIGVSVGFGDKKETLWVSCALWGERGEKLGQYLTKGSAVTVAGDVGMRTYEKKDKTTAAEMTLNVQRLTLQGGKDAGERSHRDPETATGKTDAVPDETSTDRAKDFDDDIPFIWAILIPVGGLLLHAQALLS